MPAAWPSGRPSRLLPSLMSENAIDRIAFYSVFFSQFFCVEQAKRGAYVLSILFAEFCCNRSHSLCFGITVVVTACTQKEMFWVNANTVIALMADAEFAWIGVMDMVGKPVGTKSVAAYCKNSVARGVFAGSPVPATVRSFFVYMSPEICQLMGRKSGFL